MWTHGYRVQLPPQLSATHNIFHVSQLKKCVRVPIEIIEQQEILVEPDLYYVEYPLQVLDHKERSTRREVIKMYRVQWSHHTEEEATWETENYLNENFPGFLDSTKGTALSTLSRLSESRDEILFKEGRLW